MKIIETLKHCCSSHCMESVLCLSVIFIITFLPAAAFYRMNRTSLEIQPSHTYSQTNYVNFECEECCEGEFCSIAQFHISTDLEIYPHHSVVRGCVYFAFSISLLKYVFLFVLLVKNLNMNYGFCSIKLSVVQHN